MTKDPAAVPQLLSTTRGKFVVAGLAWSSAVSAAASLHAMGVSERYTLPALVVAVPVLMFLFARHLPQPKAAQEPLEVGSVTLAWQPSTVGVADYVQALSAATGLLNLRRRRDGSTHSALTLQYRESEPLPETAVVIDLYGVQAATALVIEKSRGGRIVRTLVVLLRLVLAEIRELFHETWRIARQSIHGLGALPMSLRTARAHRAVRHAAHTSDTDAINDPIHSLKKILEKYQASGMRAEITEHDGKVVIIIVPAGESVERRVRDALESPTFSRDDRGA